MKNIKKTLYIYGLVFFLFTSFYLLLFHTPLLSSQKVLFYRGIILLVLNVIFFLFFAFIISKKLKQNFETLFAAVLVSSSINLSLFVVLPVTFERSVTMYLLNTLKNNRQNICQGMTKKELESKLIGEYIINKAIDKRANEQEIIGFIKEGNQCYQLTPKALNFLKISEIIGRLYNLQ